MRVLLTSASLQLLN